MTIARLNRLRQGYGGPPKRYAKAEGSRYIETRYILLKPGVESRP